MEYVSDSELLAMGPSVNAYGSLTQADRDAARRTASAKAGSYVGKRYGLNLVSWGDDLRRAVVDIAAYDLVFKRGFNPASSFDEELRLRADAAIAWLRDVSKGIAELVDIVDATPQLGEGGPLVASGAQLAGEAGAWGDWGTEGGGQL